MSEHPAAMMMRGVSEDVVAEAARMNNQKQFRKRRERRGPKVTEANSIQARFRRFHEKNPHVYSGLVRLARQAKRQGVTTYGLAALYEVLRWNRFLETKGEEKLKLSNDFRSRYARLIMDQEPDLKDFFGVRELTSL